MNVYKKMFRMLPYFIIEKHILGGTHRLAKLCIGENKKIPIKLYEINDGVWIAHSRKSELKNKIKTLQSKIDDMNKQMVNEGDELI